MRGFYWFRFDNGYDLKCEYRTFLAPPNSWQEFAKLLSSIVIVFLFTTRIAEDIVARITTSKAIKSYWLVARSKGLYFLKGNHCLAQQGWGSLNQLWVKWNWMPKTGEFSDLLNSKSSGEMESCFSTNYRSLRANSYDQQNTGLTVMQLKPIHQLNLNYDLVQICRSFDKYILYDR